MCNPSQGYYQGQHNAPQTGYVGDGVYAHFDGYGIALSLGDHRNPPVCHLEPEVFRKLVRFARSCNLGLVDPCCDGGC